MHLCGLLSLSCHSPSPLLELPGITTLTKNLLNPYLRVQVTGSYPKSHVKQKGRDMMERENRRTLKRQRQELKYQGPGLI